MATKEKLQKSLEALETLSNLKQLSDKSRKREKIQHCHFITEAFSNPVIKVSQNFGILVTVAVRTFLKLYDDPESDIRMKTDECLNRIIRAVSEEYIGKIQIEFSNEIKKNGSTRPLRAALEKFSQLAHHIKPQKGKAYVSWLFPKIIAVSQRSEESIHETLAASLNNIMNVLGCFASDNDINELLKAFLQNINQPSAAIRRAATTSILNICMHSRRSHLFITNCINYLTNMVLPVSDCQDVSTILGVLLCLKHLLSNITESDNYNEQFGYSKDMEVVQQLPVNKLLEIYELCLYHLTNDDHNVINASLDTLNVLICHGTNELKQKLISPNGLEKHRIHNSRSTSNLKSSNLFTLKTMSTETTVVRECDLTETVDEDIEKWLNESKLSILDISRDDISSSSLSINTNETLDPYDYTEQKENYGHLTSNNTEENIDQFSDRYSEDSGATSGLNDKSLMEDFIEIDPGYFLDKSPSLLYCTRLIVKQFLLHGKPGKYMSDKSVRVSVKSSALSCLSSIFYIYPEAFFKYLDKNYPQDEYNSNRISSQRISDIMLFIEHSDPQLRGAISVITSNLVAAILTEGNLDFDKWINNLAENDNKVFNDQNFVTIDTFINVLKMGLNDDNSNCLKQSLMSLRECFNLLAESNNCRSILPLIDGLFSIVNNSYWLVNVTLCELVAKFPFDSIFHITGSNQFQNSILNNILFEYLKSSDQRVRYAASKAIVEIINKLYFDDYNAKATVITSRAIEINKTFKFLNENYNANLYRKHFIENMPFPYNKITQTTSYKIDYALSKITMKLYNMALTTKSRYLLHGCIQALSLLSEQYPPTVYRSWCNLKDSNSAEITDLLSFCNSLFTGSIEIYDLTFLSCLLNLGANLYAGYAIALIKPVYPLETNQQAWPMYSSNSMRQLSQEYLIHLIKLLSIYHHIISNLTPHNPSNKNIATHLTSPSTLPSMKRKRNDGRKSPITPGRVEKAESRTEKKDNSKTTMIGMFAGSQHHMKLYGMLKNSFVNYKTSLDPKASENLIELIRKVLHMLLVILEVATVNEFESVYEEIVNYLHSIFLLDSTLTVRCVQQLSKCLFSRNLALIVEDILGVRVKEKENIIDTFYNNIFQIPHDQISYSLNSVKTIKKIDDDNVYLHRRNVKKPCAITEVSTETYSNHIRIFKSIIIKTLNHYMVTTDVQFQSQVTKLLSQLFEVKMDYLPIHLEQTFRNFVLKQVQYIEEGLMLESKELIQTIFQYLVHSSYLTHHTNDTISIPKIIQKSDDLMASGQDPETHCIPAFQPIVEDVFLYRNRLNTFDMKELETTREVVFVMLLRLFEYKEMIELVTLVVEDSKYCTDDIEKWLKLSEQASSVFWQMIKINKIRIDDLESFVVVRKFIMSLSPQVLNCTDDLVLLLFQPVPSTDDVRILTRWLSKILIMFLVLLPLNENILISAINKSKLEFNPKCIFDNFVPTADPLHVHNNAAIFGPIPGEEIFARMLFKVIFHMSKLLGNNSNEFFNNQLSLFLTFSLYVFQSKNLTKISNAAVNLLSNPELHIDEINHNFLNIQIYYPIMTIQWCRILSALSYSNIIFWKSIVANNNTNNCLNKCISITGSTITLCEYLVQNISETKLLAWNISENTENIVRLVNESSVSEFIAFIHRNATLSKLMVKSITTNLAEIYDPIFRIKLLKCLENCHSSQTGTVIKFLIEQMSNNRQIAFPRMMASLATQKLELLFTVPMEDVHSQLSREEILNIYHTLRVSNLGKKYETLIHLFEKLLEEVYDINSINQIHSTNKIHSNNIKSLHVDKQWYFQKIRTKCQDGRLRQETAKLLTKLNYNELIDIMSSNDFNKLILQDCVEIGVRILLNESPKEEPPILKASAHIIFQNIENIITSINSSHDIFNYLDPLPNTYTQQILIKFQDDSFRILLLNLSYSLTRLIRSVNYYPTWNFTKMKSENIAKFAVLSLEFIQFTLNNESYVPINHLNILLNCSNEILKRSYFSNYLNLDDNLFWTCSAIHALFKLVNNLLNNHHSLAKMESEYLDPTDDNCSIEILQAKEACYQLNSLIYWLYKIQNNVVDIPKFLLVPVKNLIVSLGRLSLVNSYNLVPCRVWKLGWQPEFSGKFYTKVPPLPIDMLQEVDVLEEYIFRTTLLGWTTKQQFEETWMCFLSVLCMPLDSSDSLDVSNVMHISSLAIKSITALLLQTLEFPILGHKHVSKLLHSSRNPDIPESSLSIKKLRIIQHHIENTFGLLFGDNHKQEIINIFKPKNFEHMNDQYSYGQMSIKYLLVSSNPDDLNVRSEQPTDIIYKTRKKLLEESGLDINSCLQFLLDYYTQLLKPESAFTDLRTLHETVRSILYISDLFTTKTQFTWLLDMFLDLAKIHIVREELLHPYLIVGICKAVAVISPDLETYEYTKKLLVQFLKSPFVPARVSSLYGILYILEGCIINNVTFGGISEELQIILPCAVEYVLQNLDSNNPALKTSQEHLMLLWSLAFYLIENVDEIHMELNFVHTILQRAFEIVQNKLYSRQIQKAIFKNIERLLLVKPVYMLNKFAKNIEKLALDKLKEENCTESILGLQLLTSYMYTDCWEHLEKNENENEQSNPEHLVQTVEKLSAIFERIKKSYTLEVELLCSVLPFIIRDFFSPSDILTKVIGEFLSPQQPHPKLMSGVVFCVFESAIEQKHLLLLQEWVVLSLSNFIQSSSNMAVWSLTCFFISASTNPWIKSYFPYIQARVGRYEYEDREIFCIAGSDFYRNLTDAKQKQAFIENFSKVKDDNDTLFSDLLNGLTKL